MSTMPFRIVCRRAMAAGLALALVVPHASLATPPKRARAGDPRARAAKVAKPAKVAEVAKVAIPLPAPDVSRSEAAERLLAWIALAHDNGELPYAVIDKHAASLLLFAANGAEVGQVPVLLGVGVGDDSSPGIGAKDLAEIGPAERTTPAGRFVAKFGRAFGRQRVLWVDYANSVALHAVITTHKQEHRVERLRSASADDNRITFGCINVDSGFYTGKLRPLFRKQGGVVYILPDTKSLDDVFPRVRLLPYLSVAKSE